MNKEHSHTNHDPNDLLRKEFDSKINRLRNDLIRQEHRFLPALRNLYLAFKEGDGSTQAKEKKLSALLAFGMVLWKRRIQALIVATIGGIVGSTIAILTLVEFKKQNEALQEQNQQILEQNNLFQEQNRQQIVSTSGQMVSDLIGDLYKSRHESKLPDDSPWDIPEPLLHRIVIVADALQPYDSTLIEISGKKDTTIAFSKERGQLLKALVSMKTVFPLDPNPDFSHANLFDADLMYAN